MSRRLHIHHRARSQGQALILFACAAMVALAFVGLAIDGSNLLAQRRILQNAADSGALAGANLIAGRQSTNEEVLGAVRSYAGRHVPDDSTVEAYYFREGAPLGAVADYQPNSLPPAEAVGVRVIARRSVRVLFGGVLGQRRKAVGAEASAASGVAKSLALGRDAFPVTIEDDVLDSVSPGDAVVLWDDSRVTDSSGNPLGGDRAWLNLDYVYSADDPDGRTVSRNQSNSKLKSWVIAGKEPPVTLVAGGLGKLNGDFIDGDPGVRSSALASATLRVGARVVIPVYDVAYRSGDLEEEGLPRPAAGWPNQSLYHIVGFAEFRITGVRHGKEKGLEGEFLRSSLKEGAMAWGGEDADVFRSDESTLTVRLVEGYGSPAAAEE